MSKNIFKIDEKLVGGNNPTYFIADIAANHDGDLEKAKELIYMCAEAGADAAKFQHFSAETIVSDFGFKNLGSKQSHQEKWSKSVYEVYKDASLNIDWTPILKETCQDAGIAFFTSPYSYELVDHVDKYVTAYKIGSGDITWLNLIKYIANKNKPMIIASGASSFEDVCKAMDVIQQQNNDICLMQCNTNYTGSLENFKYINLNVINTFKKNFPNVVLGLSDHTPGHTTVLGAVAYGAKMIEKHFTDDQNRDGPDHQFSMNPKTWKEMVERTRELEYALGDGIKIVEQNEKETVILQRRAIRIVKDLPSGHTLSEDDLICLRPCPNDAIEPFEYEMVIGKTISREMNKGSHLKWTDLK